MWDKAHALEGVGESEGEHEDDADSTSVDVGVRKEHQNEYVPLKRTNPMEN